MKRDIVKKYELGGDPTNPPKKVKPKYDPDKEMSDAFAANKTLRYDNNRSIKDVIMSAAKKGNIDPALLLSSSWQEGMNKAVLTPDKVSDGFLNAEEGFLEFVDPKTKKVLKERTTQNKLDTVNFPVDGFYNYGLDTFGENYNQLKKYLPQDFESRFQFYDAYNDAKDASGNPTPTKVRTAAFKTNEDALIAKAAFLNLERDRISSYAKSKNVDLSQDPDALNYFTIAGYNRGYGGARKSFDKYLAAPDRSKYIKEVINSTDPENYVAPRVRRIGLSNKLLSMKKGGRLEYQFGTEDPITTGGPQLNPGAQNVGIDVFKNANTSPVPINPNAPADQQIFALQPQEGDPVQQTDIVPLSQFYEQYTDQYGNQQARGTGRYVNDQGQSNTLANQQKQFDQMSQQNLENANKKEANMTEDEKYASFGMTAINSYFNKKNSAQQQRKNRRAAIMQEIEASTLSPYLEGTGSQAIFEKGGKIPAQTPGLAITDGGKAIQVSDNIHSSPMIEFKGKEHKKGGIGVQYGNSIAEVENKEIGWVDQEGGLNIFGKLKLPGTNMTFRKAAKNITEQEDKTDRTMQLYTNILNNGDPADPYQQSSQSTAKVMFKSLDKQQKQIAEKKEALASYQNLILSMVDQGVKMKYGGKLPRKPYETGGEITPEELKRIREAIGEFESGNNYQSRGVVVTKGRYKGQRALGRYQIMPGNLKAWSKEALGREVSEEEFLSSPDIQDNIAEHQMAQIARTHSKPEDIASIWFTGRPASQGGSSKDDMGTSGNQYVKSVMGIYAGIPPDDVFEYKGVKFNRKDAQGLKDLVDSDKKFFPGEESEWHPMNTTDKADYQRLTNYLNNSTGNSSNPNDTFEYKGVKFSRADAQSLKNLVDSDDPNDPDKHPMHSADKADYDRLVAFLNGKPSTTNSSNNTTGGTGGTTHKEKSVNVLDYTPKYTPVDETGQKVNSGLVETKYGPAAREATPFSDKVTLQTGDKKRGWQSPLAMEQIAPELITIATNRQEPVEQLTYQPDLLQTFDISYQLGRNENQSSFNQAVKTAESMGNTEALSQLAAQKYKADEAYNMQEVQGNAQQKQQVYAQNVATLNDAKVKNLALIADQQVKQAQAKFNTRKEDIGAFTSISGKVLQNTLENKTYNAYANLFQHYGFDKMGNVTFEPDKVVKKFTAGEAQQFGMLSAQQGANAIMSGDFNRQFRKVKNADGSTTTTEILGRNGEIQAKARALKAQGFDDMIIGNMLRAEFPETISQD